MATENDSDLASRDAAELQEKIAATQSNIIRHPANTDRNAALHEIFTRNQVVRSIIEHHATYPFLSLSLTCKESVEAKNFYLKVLQSINFGSILGDITKELLKIGEVIMIFEGSWIPPKFLDPDRITVTEVPNATGQLEEHVEYRVDDELREMVLNTPKEERANLMKMLDAYSIRQVELGRPIDLTRSPFIKVLHPRRRTALNPTAHRGVSFLEPIADRLIESEGHKLKILRGESSDYSTMIKKIRETDRLAFDYAFPKNLEVLENEFKYLQEIVRHMLLEEIFSYAAMAKNFSTPDGLILPELHFAEISLKDNDAFIASVQNMRYELGIDRETISIDDYVRQIRDSA